MSKKKATCHPDRPHYAKGLCRKCYRQKHRAENLDTYRDREQKWRDENRERYREMQREFFAANPNWVQEYRGRNTEKIRKQVKSWLDKRAKDDPDFVQRCHLKRVFGITVEAYNDILELQRGACAICGKTPEENGRRLAVDHSHETGEIRGLLCTSCNTGIGLLREDPEILWSAIEYIGIKTKREP